METAGKNGNGNDDEENDDDLCVSRRRGLKMLLKEKKELREFLNISN